MLQYTYKKGEVLRVNTKKLKVGSSKTSDKENDLQVIIIQDPKMLGAIVKKIRKKSKMTQEEIAIYANVSRLAIIEFESGKSDIKLSTLLKILNACDLDLEIRAK